MIVSTYKIHTELFFFFHFFMLPLIYLQFKYIHMLIIIIIFFLWLSFRSFSLCPCLYVCVYMCCVRVCVFLCITFFVLKHSKHLFFEKRNENSVFFPLLKSEFFFFIFRGTLTTFLYKFQSTNSNFG